MGVRSDGSPDFEPSEVIGHEAPLLALLAILKNKHPLSHADQIREHFKVPKREVLAILPTVPGLLGDTDLCPGLSQA